MKKNIMLRSLISEETFRGTIERGTQFAASSYGQPVNHIELETGGNFDLSDDELLFYEITYLDGEV
jgi:hypothetical protein